MARTSTAKAAKQLSPAKVEHAHVHMPDGSAVDRFRQFPFPDEDGYATSDALTGLMWSHTLGDSVVHKKAQGQVDALNARKFAGHDDWRLPTVEELFLIADRTKVRPAIDETFFPDTKSDWYWSSSSCADAPDYAWFVYFYHGYAYWGYRHSVAWVRAVRGPSARASQ